MILDEIMTVEEALAFAYSLAANGCPRCGSGIIEDGMRDADKLKWITLTCSNEECEFKVEASTDFDSYLKEPTAAGG